MARAFPAYPLDDTTLLVVAAHALRNDPIRDLHRRRRRQFARMTRHGALLLGYLFGFAAGARWALEPRTYRRWEGN